MFSTSWLIVTDGRMGYCDLKQKDGIIESRRVETYASCEVLGLDQEYVHYIDYPDCGLDSLQGRREPQAGIEAIQGYIGLQNAMCYYLRRLRPARVFVPSPADLHPDHRITYSELMISLFHASGPIWPELGESLSQTPRVYEMAVYCDFIEPPNLQVYTDQHIFERKLESIAAFRSQAQISQLVENIRESGPYEYLREVRFKLYQPSTYTSLFR